MQIETTTYNNKWVVQSEVTITCGDVELVIVDKSNLDHLETYGRTPGADLPFARLEPEFYRHVDWPDPPESVDMDTVTGTVTID